MPPIAEVDFKIAFLATEGQQVKQGESVLRLDTEMLERQLAEKRAELQEAQKKVEQKEIDLGMKLLDLEQQAAQAKADLGRAQLKVDVPPEVQQRIELDRAKLDKQGRERDLQNLDAEGRVTRAVTGAELASLRQVRDRASGRVAALEAAIEKMNITRAAGRDRGLQAELARREEEGRRLGLVRRGGAGAAGPRRDEGRRLRGRGGRRPGARGPAGHAAARGALRLRPLRQGGEDRAHRAPALLAHAAQGLQGRDRAREDRSHLHAARDALPRRGRDGAHPRGRAGAARGGVPARLGPVVWARRALGWTETR